MFKRYKTTTGLAAFEIVRSLCIYILKLRRNILTSKNFNIFILLKSSSYLFELEIAEEKKRILERAK